MEQLIQFLKNQFREGFFNSKLLNTKDISDPIVRAIKDKEVPSSLSIVNHEDISSSIVDAQDKTTKAIESLVLPTTDLTELIEKIGELKSAINDKDLSVSVGDTKIDVDTKGIISALKRLQQSVEDSKTTIEPQEVIDYTSYLDEIITNINKPGYDFSGIEKILERISAKEFVLPLDEKGNVKVSFEGKPFGSSGSRALSSAQETVLRGIATEETLQDSLFHYKLAKLPVSGDTYTYLGYLNKDGGWYISKTDETAGIVTYIKGDSDLDTAWSSRASNSYQAFNVIF